MRRQHLALIVLAAIAIALVAWLLFASRSDAPEGPSSRSGAPDEAPLPDGRIYFSAGGSIYRVRPDGSALTRIIEGMRGDPPDPDGQRRWASSPSVSPNGRTLAFVRDYDVWVSDADGADQRRLIDAGDWVYHPCCASNSSIGGSSVAWSPDGRRLLYISSRIGGSGITEVWTADADGSNPLLLSDAIPSFRVAGWVATDVPMLYADDSGLRVMSLDNLVPYSLRPRPEDPADVMVSALRGPGVVVGHFIKEGSIFIGPPGSLRRTTSGLAPAASLDGGWIAFLRGDELRIARVDASGDRLVLDLGTLGGRDKLFAEADCSPRPPAKNPPGCSFRPPVLGWGP